MKTILKVLKKKFHYSSAFIYGVHVMHTPQVIHLKWITPAGSRLGSNGMEIWRVSLLTPLTP